MISLKNINVFSDNTHILKDITFEIPDASVTAIIGASGSGKTTLLRAIIGLIQPTNGELSVNGQNLMHLAEKERQEVRKKMAIVFQHGALFDSLTAWENVAFPICERRSITVSDARKEAERLLDLFDLQGAADLPISRCSGGMQMRIAIARAFAYNPEIILYDEPTSGLDPIARDLICDLIQRQQFLHHMTSILVTHQLSTAFSVSNFFVVLHNGEVIFRGDADELMTSANPQIQRFIRPASRSYRQANLHQY